LLAVIILDAAIPLFIYLNRYEAANIMSTAYNVKYLITSGG
jgi:hypothetical protein